MTPATALGMLIAFCAMAPFAQPGGLSSRDVLLLAALGAGQIALGLILFTAGARLIPAAQAGLISLLEVVLGPLWVWLIYSEKPDAATLVGGSVIIAAVLLHALAELRPAGRVPARSERTSASTRSSQLPASWPASLAGSRCSRCPQPTSST